MRSLRPSQKIKNLMKMEVVSTQSGLFSRPSPARRIRGAGSMLLTKQKHKSMNPFIKREDLSITRTSSTTSLIKLGWERLGQFGYIFSLSAVS